MRPNEGTADRAVRVIAGFALVAVAFYALGLTAGAVLGIVVAAVGAVLILTGVIGFCPAYRICGLSTCGVGKPGAS